MPITIAGSGTITGISAGGLPDDSIIAADIAAGAVTTVKIADANITAAKLDGAQSGSAPIYAARAWVNFDGTTASPSTRRGSGNVSSVTKNGTGDYTINFTTALPDANYSFALSVDSMGASAAPVVVLKETVASFMTASLIRIGVGNISAVQDRPYISVVIFR